VDEPQEYEFALCFFFYDRRFFIFKMIFYNGQSVTTDN